MVAGRMHADELETNVALVTGLIASQFPQWAALQVRPFASSGTDSSIYRLGDHLCVRLPRRPSSTTQLEKDRAWLPRLAPLLPLAIPEPLGLGRPTEAYPSPWGVYRWLEGEPATAVPLAGSIEAARALAGFVRALHSIDPTGGPPPGSHNFHRGVPLARRGVPVGSRDAATRGAIEALGDRVDARAVSEVWEAALRVPEWEGAPAWIHGDLLPGNLLVRDGRLAAVIDWGGLGVGDPACDVMPAWTVFAREAREAYRAALEVDDATWERGRGWALSVALIQLPYYWDTNPELAQVARWTIAEVLADR